MNKTDNNYKLLYKTNNRNDHTEEKYHWFEFRLKGDVIYKYRCQKQKVLENNKNSWITEEIIEETWLADSSYLPEFLKQIIKSSKDPEIKKFSVMRTIENPNGYESKNYFKNHKKAVIIVGSVTAVVAIGMTLLSKNIQFLTRCVS